MRPPGTWIFVGYKPIYVCARVVQLTHELYYTLSKITTDTHIVWLHHTDIWAVLGVIKHQSDVCLSVNLRWSYSDDYKSQRIVTLHYCALYKYCYLLTYKMQHVSYSPCLRHVVVVYGNTIYTHAHTRTRALTDTYMLSIVNCFYTMSAY